VPSGPASEPESFLSGVLGQPARGMASNPIDKKCRLERIIGFSPREKFGLFGNRSAAWRRRGRSSCRLFAERWRSEDRNPFPTGRIENVGERGLRGERKRWARDHGFVVHAARTEHRNVAIGGARFLDGD